MTDPIAPDTPEAPDTIRITREDAFSDHVEDLLNRQRSLRGEGGVTREHRARWYYRNWFVFMVVGLIASIAAWALLEPFLDDHLYIQGIVTKVSVEDFLQGEEAPSKELLAELGEVVQRYITVNDEQILISSQTRLIRNGKIRSLFEPTMIEEGEEIGVYVEQLNFGYEELNVALYIDITPKKPAPAKAKMPLERLSRRDWVAGHLFFSVIAGFIGLAIGAVDGLVCRMVRRALIGGFVGLLIGLLGGFLMGLMADFVYGPLTMLAHHQSEGAGGGLGALGFLIQVGGRGIAWALVGMAMGLGYGISLLSKRLVLYGFLGGILGGLLGGLLFDPIDLLLVGDAPGAQWSRLVGVGVIGAAVGASIGFVELLSRDVWLRMTQGPLAGKEFILFKDTMLVGASPRSDIYLFNDPTVADHHATMRQTGDDVEIESTAYGSTPVYVNGRPVRRTRLRSGDQIGIGNTYFIYEKRNA